MRHFRLGSSLAMAGGLLAAVAALLPLYSLSFLGFSVQASMLSLALKTPPVPYQPLCVLPLIAASALLLLALIGLFGRSLIVASLAFVFGGLGLGFLVLLYRALLAPPDTLANYLAIGFWVAALGFLLGLIGGLLDGMH